LPLNLRSWVVPTYYSQTEQISTNIK
jgi:hypothetical protein